MEKMKKFNITLEWNNYRTSEIRLSLKKLTIKIPLALRIDSYLTTFQKPIHICRIKEEQTSTLE